MVIHNLGPLRCRYPGLTSGYPHPYRCLLASPVFLTIYTYSLFWSSHDKAHFPAKYASPRQEAWLPRPHGYPCRPRSPICSPRKGPLKALCVRSKSPTDLFVLPTDARLTSSSDFARATKSGIRVTSEHFVGYLYISPVTNESSPKCGLIINKTVGGSVKRHRLARKVRHAVAPLIATLPTGSLLVIRALKQSDDKSVIVEISDLLEKLNSRAKKFEARA